MALIVMSLLLPESTENERFSFLKERIIITSIKLHL